jgi:predicted kinase
VSRDALTESWSCFSSSVGCLAAARQPLAQRVAKKLSAAYVRVDAIEAALWHAGISQDEPTDLAAYVVAQAVAEGSLSAGASVVVDAVNPVEEARQGWRDLADRSQKPLRVIEVVCSDVVEHRRRVETRESDREGHAVPTWAAVEAREYEPWEPRLVVDTCAEAAEDSVARILDYVHRNGL